MRRTLCSSFLVLTVFCSRNDRRESDVQLARRDFVGGRISALVPSSFRESTAELVGGSEFVGSTPATVLSSEDRAIQIEIVVVGRSASKPTPEFKAPHDQLLRLIGDGIRNGIPAIELLRDEVVTDDGRPRLVLDFHQVRGGIKTRQLMAMTIGEDEATLLLGFSCRAADEQTWLPIGQRIIDSVQTSG